MVNKSGWPARMGDKLSFRYYFTLEPGVTPSMITLQANYNQCTSPKAPVQVSGNVYYITVDCTGTLIYPGGQSAWRKEVQFRIDSSGAWDPTNDWSYTGVSTVPGSTPVKVDQHPALRRRHEGLGQRGPIGPTCTVVPPAVSTLSAQIVSSSEIDLSWSAVTPPANCSVTYNVYRSTTNGFTPSASNRIASGLTTTSLKDLSLAASTTYYYAVESVDAAGTAASVARVSGTTLPAPTCSAAPAAPTSVTARAVSSTRIDLAWAAVTPPANCSVTYSVYRGTTSGFTPSASNQVATGLTSPAFSNTTGLVASTTYYYVVQAVDAAGATAAAQVSATTLPPSTCSAAPAAPTSLTATAVSSSRIDLAWAAVTPPANCSVTYSVFRSTTSGFTPSSTSQVATGLTSPAFSNTTGLTAGTTYYYVVQAVDAAGATGSAQVSAATPSNTCSAVPPAPAPVSATAVSSSEIDLSWGASAPPANCSVTYNVYRSTTSGFTPSASNQVASGLTSTSFANTTGLSASTAYYYVVQAVDAAGATSSVQVTATTSPTTGGGCHVGYTIVNSWPGGFQAALSIQNTSATAWTSWTVKWTFPGDQKINQLWNGSFTQTGSAVTVTSLGYNGSVPAGGSYTGVGFTGTFGSNNTAPASFTVNGVTCN